MHVIKRNLFEVGSDAICITTNGFVKADGSCVMGRGVAKQAADMFEDLPKQVGEHIKRKGNAVNVVRKPHALFPRYVVTFPVKPVSIVMDDKFQVVKHMRNKFKVGDTVPGWACVADLEIIERSCQQLVGLTDDMKWGHVHLPKPGCGAGELSWTDVSLMLEKYLDDRFWVVDL